MDIEKRFVQFRATRTSGADNKPGPLVLDGLVLPYGKRAKIGQFSEEFRAGAFKASGTLDDVIVNIQHDRTKPVARTGAGLVLNDDEDALRAVIDVPETSYGREAAELVEARILQGFSVEFRAIEQEWNGKHRIVTAAHLVGIGLVDRPAYSDAQIAKRFLNHYGAHRKGNIRYYY